MFIAITETENCAVKTAITRRKKTLRVAEGSGTAKSMLKNMDILHGKETILVNFQRKSVGELTTV